MLNHEKVLRLLHQNASALVDTNDEAMAIMFAVAWQPELGDDLPFGTAVFKGVEAKPEAIMGCLRQVSKLGLHLLTTMGGWSKVVANAAQVKKLQGEVDDLKKRLGKYETVETPQATRPSGGGVDTRGPQGPGSGHD